MSCTAIDLKMSDASAWIVFFLCLYLPWLWPIKFIVPISCFSTWSVCSALRIHWFEYSIIPSSTETWLFYCIMTLPFYISISSLQGFQPYISISLYLCIYIYIYILSAITDAKVVSHCGFTFLRQLVIFIYLLRICISSLEKYLSGL